MTIRKEIISNVKAHHSNLTDNWIGGQKTSTLLCFVHPFYREELAKKLRDKGKISDNTFKRLKTNRF